MDVTHFNICFVSSAFDFFHFELPLPIDPKSHFELINSILPFVDYSEHPNHVAFFFTNLLPMLQFPISRRSVIQVTQATPASKITILFINNQSIFFKIAVIFFRFNILQSLSFGSFFFVFGSNFPSRGSRWHRDPPWGVPCGAPPGHGLRGGQLPSEPRDAH